MDCDFSHDPADVPRLIAAAEEGADLVLGSRYVPGGAIPNWGARAALDLARRHHLRALFLQMGVRDLTGGFKCFRREVLETIDLDAIGRGATRSRSRPPTGSCGPGFRVVEVPISFADREPATRR